MDMDKMNLSCLRQVVLCAPYTEKTLTAIFISDLNDVGSLTEPKMVIT